MDELFDTAPYTIEKEEEQQPQKMKCDAIRERLNRVGMATRFYKGQKRSLESIQKQRETMIRKRKSRELANEMLAMVLDPERVVTAKEEIVLSLMEKALKGDVRAIELLFKLTGEDLTTTIKVDGVVPISAVKLVDNLPKDNEY